MKSDRLLEALEYIDEKYIIEVNEPKSNAKPRKLTRKLLLIAIIALLCATIIVPTFSVRNTGADQILFALFPKIAQKLKPVSMSCEDNGILMEVISANVTDTEAQVYISLKDLVSNRIDETTDLFDSYRIHRPFDSSATCDMINFDDETGTATFLIQIWWKNNTGISGSKVTFSLSEFISHKHKYEKVLVSDDLASVTQAPSTQRGVSIRGGSYIDENSAEYYDNPDANFLVPNRNGLFVPAKGVQITALGYIDNRLHIQTKYDNILEYDNHGYVYLVDSNGNEYHCTESVSFWADNQTDSYDEEIFNQNITPEVLSECKLYGNFYTCDTNTKGEWEVTFVL